METLSNTLWREYINGYKEEIKYMDDVEGFIKDNTIQKGTCLEKVLGSHIMYRVNLHTDDNLLSVKGENKRYKYEFLVEFDTNTPEYGIYYGCRAVIEPGFNDENLLYKDSFLYVALEGETDTIVQRCIVHQIMVG